MARRKVGRSRRRGMGGLMAYIIPIAAGTLVGAYTDKIPVVKDMPMGQGLAGAGAGFIVKRNPMGAALGAMGGYFLGTPLRHMIDKTVPGAQAAGW